MKDDPDWLEKLSKPLEEQRLQKLAERIKDGIKVKKWSRKRFAQEMNVAPSVVTKWLSGTNNFEFDTLVDIERVLEINIFIL